MIMLKRSVAEASRFYMFKAGRYGFALACFTFALLRFTIPYDPVAELQNVLITTPNAFQSETSRRMEAFFASLIWNEAGTQLSGFAVIWLGALFLFLAHPFLIIGGRMLHRKWLVQGGLWIGVLSIGLVFGLGLFLIFPLLELVL
jgi:hypothetical protein